MDDRTLVTGRWVASWTNVTYAFSNTDVQYAFAATLGLFAFNEDGSVTGEFRMKDGTTYNVRTFTGNFDVSRDAANEVLNGTVTVTINGTGTINTLNFVRVNADELTFVLQEALKVDGTPRTQMVHGNFHRVSPP